MFNFISFCDVPENWQLSIQDPATPVAEGMISFNNYLVFFMVIIGVFVFWMLFSAIKTFSSTPSKFSHSSLLEIIWTIIPAVILIFIAVPSFTLLYSLDDSSEPLLTIKIIGHQWYWSYEYNDYLVKEKKLLNINYDSYMLATDDLTIGSFRLLEVDNRMIVPTHSHVRLLITSSDVLHSWAIPSFGIKTDACPGRLNQVSLFVKREGVFYGQCSEICGINHGFMPIVVKAVYPYKFLEWIKTKSVEA
jgi:cytochrome c oxidase subunit 2